MQPQMAEVKWDEQFKLITTTVKSIIAHQPCPKMKRKHSHSFPCVYSWRNAEQKYTKAHSHHCKTLKA